MGAQQPPLEQRHHEVHSRQQLARRFGMRKTAAENKKAYRPDAYVFGDDETGERITSIRTAWQNCRLKAFGFKVTRDHNGKLTAVSRAHLKAINIRFHDWRRPAGSRFMAGGMSLHYVQRFLDHANLSTTSRYLKIGSAGHAQRAEGVREGARRRYTSRYTIG
jgi:integrase